MRRVLRESGIVAWRIAKELRRNRRMLIFWAVFPALMLLLFGLIYAGRSSPAKSFDYTAPGILIGAALFFSCLGGPIATIVAERENGTLRRILLSPLSGVSYFLGVLLAYLLIAAAQALLVFGIAFAFGGRFHGSLLLGAVILVLAVASYCGLGFFFGASFTKRTEDVNGPVAAFGVPLLVLGGTFFPPTILPPFLLAAAWLNPIFHMNEALKAVAAGGAGARDIQAHLLVLAVFAILAVLLGALSYRRLLKIEQAG